MKRTFNVVLYGAIGDGVHDDTVPIQTALDAAVAASGQLVFPPGVYRITDQIVAFRMRTPLAIRGDGSNVSVILADNCQGMFLQFDQKGIQQPYGLTMRDIGFRARGSCPAALNVNYGTPPVTNEHQRPSCSLNNIVVESSDEGSWNDGIVVVGAWNLTMQNVFVSGAAVGGVWNYLHGSGITLRWLCANAHLTNVRCNFWAVGLQVHADGGVNTEGIYCSNCSMVAVKRGVWIQGNPKIPESPRISTFVWNGGLIECRVGGVVGGSAAFHFQNVWTALVSGCQMIAETITGNVETTYGLCIQDCHGIVVTGCDINAFIMGVLTTGDCRAVNIAGNSYTNCAMQVIFSEGTTRSRSYGAVLVNNTPSEQDVSGLNKMGFVS